MNKKVRDIIFWNSIIAVVFVMFLLSLLTFYEFFNVRIRNQTESYPWGPVNENPWYYSNHETYSIVMLSEGIIFIICCFLISFFAIKSQKKSAFLAAIMSLFVLMLSWINGSIQ